MTEGMKTSEFWVTIATIAAATLLCAIGKITPELWAFVAVGGVGTYSISRGVAKHRNPR